jgi:hypothetical protein
LSGRSFAPEALWVPAPAADDHRMDGIGLEVPAVVVAPVLLRAILVIGGQACAAHDLRLPPFGPIGILGDRP